MSDPPATIDVRGLFMGSGSGLAEPEMAEHVIELVGKPASHLRLLYLGTATYDAVEARERQTVRFAEMGCRVTALDVATRTPQPALVDDLIEQADAILVSGGNTLYAVDRWKTLGVDTQLRGAVGSGAVVCGGSAGAICWFDGGHSDSMDPTSYLDPVPDDDSRVTDWRYIRVDGLGLVPGLLCPHYDVTQSNGVLRAADFEAMMRRHPGETGLGLDNWAGLLVDGDGYRVVTPGGRPGSVRGDEFVADGSGLPGLWVLECEGPVPTRRLAPTVGAVADLVRPARAIEPDPLLRAARAENPQTGS